MSVRGLVFGRRTGLGAFGASGLSGGGTRVSKGIYIYIYIYITLNTILITIIIIIIIIIKGL